MTIFTTDQWVILGLVFLLGLLIPTAGRITVLGHDRPGIIAETTGILAGLGLNLEDTTMTLLLMVARRAGAANICCLPTFMIDLSGMIDGSLATLGPARRGRL